MNGIEEDRILDRKKKKNEITFITKLFANLTIIILTIIRRLNLDIMFTEE